MARYIDADLLHIKMEDLYEHHIEMRNYSADGAVADCLDMLDNTPTADVVEVVRCKDCKHEYTDPFCQMWCRLYRKHEGERLVEENHFCSYGERKENE